MQEDAAHHIVIVPASGARSMVQLPAPALLQAATPQPASSPFSTDEVWATKAAAAGISTNAASAASTPRDLTNTLSAHSAKLSQLRLSPSSGIRSSISSPSKWGLSPRQSHVMDRAFDGVTNAACNAMASGLGAVGMAASTAIRLLRAGELEGAMGVAPHDPHADHPHATLAC